MVHDMFMDNVKSSQSSKSAKNRNILGVRNSPHKCVRVCAPLAEAPNIRNERVFFFGFDLDYCKTRNRIALKKFNGIYCFVE